MRGRLSFGIAVAAFLLSAATAPGDSRRRLSLDEVLALPLVTAGGGTSGLSTIETRLLKGDPMQPGLYTISIKAPPNTRISAHTHRDDRTAVVVAGVWHFGNGPVAEEASTHPLAPGSFYTEPADESHFAWTDPEGATVYITGEGPTDTR